MRRLAGQGCSCSRASGVVEDRWEEDAHCRVGRKEEGGDSKERGWEDRVTQIKHRRLLETHGGLLPF